ncbi:uncharacterized protein [Dermacentor andersoni]|uniref:uncharacterized protein n=1 Tax=Dermacentor andersoni TaxID=34620 RepID=UPI0021559956|nr:zinc finger protein 335-like [Dermacentor andersoni]XP_054931197.1 zinc finger protein 335-like [Dermacentor andersoni]
MQPSAGPSRSLPSTSADNGQYVERNYNLPTQSNRQVLKFSLTHELFPDLRQPAPANENRTLGPSSNSHQVSNPPRDTYMQSAFTSLRCKFCGSECADKGSLLRHLRRHNRVLSREIDVLLEQLVFTLDAIDADLDDAPRATFSGQNRTANVTLEQTQVRERLATQRSCHVPDQTAQQTHRVNSSNNVGVPPGKPNAPEQLEGCVDRASQTSQTQVLSHRRQVSARRNSVGPVVESSQNLTTFGTTLESCRTALGNGCVIQQPAQQPTVPGTTVEDNVRRTLQPNCAGSVEYRLQSQAVKTRKRPSPPEPRAAPDSARCSEGLVLAQATSTLSPTQYILYTANAPVGDSGSDVLRSPTEVAPSNEDATSAFLNIASTQHLGSSTTTSSLYTERQGLAVQIESATLLICCTERSALDGSLVNPLDLTEDAHGPCITASTSGLSTSRPKRVRAVTWIPPPYANNDDNRPSSKASGSTPCHESIGDEVTSRPLPTPCTEANAHGTSSTDEVTRAVREPSYGGDLVANISIHHEQEDRRTACDEDTADNASWAQHWEQELEHVSTHEITPSPPPCDLGTRERHAIKQEKEEAIAKEGSLEKPAYDNADTPLSAPCVADPTCGRGIVKDESLEHPSEEQSLDKAELPLPAPSVARPQGLKRKKGVSRDNVAKDSRTKQRSKQFQVGSVDEAEVSAAPPGITESACGLGTSRPKRLRAVTWNPPIYAGDDYNRPSAKASGSTARHESAPPCSKDDKGVPASPPGAAKTWQCPSCTSVLSSRSSLCRHRLLMHTRQKPLNCQQCTKTFRLNETLRNHVRTVHTAETWQCPSCSKVLSCKYSFDRHHLLMHAAQKPLNCPHCTRTFGLKETLRNHVRSAHTGERPFECHLCPSSFAQKTSLHQHLVWHRNERRFECKLCPNTFIVKGHLKRHMRSHTNERPFLCSLCPKQLSSSHALKRHLLTHTGERPHKCEVCGKTFRLLSTLQAHVARFHPTEISLD